MNFFSRVKAAGSIIVGKSAGGWEKMFEGIGAGNNNADLGRPYANSVWVSAAIKFVAGPISAVPIIFTEDRRGGDVEIENPELTKFWQKPAKTKGGLMTQSAFLTATVGWLKLRGESFWILDDTWLMPRAKKSPLIVARPSEMREILSADRELIGWQYLDGRGKQSTLIPEQVRNIKFWNPYNEFRGLGEWEAAKMAADADYAQGVFARNLAKNNGDRGPIVIGKSGVASKEQQDQITALLRQKRELARQGDYRPIFLTGDIDVKEPGLQAVDAAYVAQRLENRHEIFVAFGVPPSFADVSASYSIGSASDRFKLIEETCMPLATMIADEIEAVTAMFLNDGKTIFADFDWTRHSTMQAVRREIFGSFKEAVGIGMPPRTAGEYFDLALPRFPGDETCRSNRLHLLRLRVHISKCGSRECLGDDLCAWFHLARWHHCHGIDRGRGENGCCHSGHSGDARFPVRNQWLPSDDPGGFGDLIIPPFHLDRRAFFNSQRTYDVDFNEVRGQHHVKRALEVAAAGGHNLLTLYPIF